MILALIHDWSELATMASAETGGPAIGDWEMARNVSEWIEVVAILVIAIALLVAVVEMARSALRGQGGARVYVVFKTYFSGGVLLGLDLLIAARARGRGTLALATASR